MLCPLDKKECVKGECAIYSTIYEDTCGIASIELQLDELIGKKEQQ